MLAFWVLLLCALVYAQPGVSPNPTTFFHTQVAGTWVTPKPALVSGSTYSFGIQPSLDSVTFFFNVSVTPSCAVSAGWRYTFVWVNESNNMAASQLSGDVSVYMGNASYTSTAWPSATTLGKLMLILDLAPVSLSACNCFEILYTSFTAQLSPTSYPTPIQYWNNGVIITPPSSTKKRGVDRHQNSTLNKRVCGSGCTVCDAGGLGCAIPTQQINHVCGGYCSTCDCHLGYTQGNAAANTFSHGVVSVPNQWTGIPGTQEKRGEFEERTAESGWYVYWMLQNQNACTGVGNVATYSATSPVPGMCLSFA